MHESLDQQALAHAHHSAAELKPGQTVSEAIESIRTQSLESAIVYFYVVDEGRRLVGVVPTRRLLCARPDQLVSAIMTEATTTVPRDASLRDAAAALVEHRLLAVPIVDDGHRLLGVVDAAAVGGDVSEDITGHYRRDLFQLIGVRIASKPGERFRSRMSALTWNIVGGLIAAGVAAVFDDLLRTVAALALFMPVTLALSESIGMQAVVLALESPKPRRGRRFALIRDELIVAAPLALVCGTIVALVALAWLRHWTFAVVVVIAIAIAMAAAAVIGTIVPRVLTRWRWNPTVAAGPAVLALADFVSLLAYFSVASALLR